MKFFTSGLLISALTIISLFSCKNNPAGQNNDGLTFYYYPKTNVYYDVTNASYIYSLDGGRNWTTLLDTSKKPGAQLGQKFIIKSNTSEIWKENETHRKMYGGTLINLVKRDTGNINSQVLKPKPQIKKKKVLVNTDSILLAQQPHKKRNIFQRIFGKKKRKKQADQQTLNTTSN